MSGAWPQAAVIVGGTLVAEDATCLAVGVLVHAGALDPVLGITAAAVGIAMGDLGLWPRGRLGAERLRRWRWLAAKVPTARMAGSGDALARRLGRLLQFGGECGRITAGCRSSCLP